MTIFISLLTTCAASPFWVISVTKMIQWWNEWNLRLLVIIIIIISSYDEREKEERKWRIEVSEGKKITRGLRMARDDVIRTIQADTEMHMSHDTKETVGRQETCPHDTVIFKSQNILGFTTAGSMILITNDPYPTPSCIAVASWKDHHHHRRHGHHVTSWHNIQCRRDKLQHGFGFPTTRQNDGH